jgi:V/A-type H+-transporting ATPase subunit D
MQTNPTRINLINTRKSMVIAKKGYSVLKRKREVLVIEFLRLLKDSTHDKGYVMQKLSHAYRSLALALAYTGDFELGYASEYVNEPKPIAIEMKDIMGVKVPEIEHIGAGGSILSRGYSIVSTSSAVDDVNESFGEVLNALIDLAKREQGLKRLVLEIEKVKRRVNALDYILIPTLNRRAKYISMRLDEMDRDTFSALKHIKRKLQRKSAA